MSYLKDPHAIYEASFAIIRQEVDLAALPASAHDIALRVVHSCGMPDIVQDLRFSPDFASAALSALQRQKPVLTDAEMVRQGIINRQVPIICTLNNPEARTLGITNQTTRSAAAVDLWQNDIAGSLVVIGNAPTALFRLLELIDAGWPKPAAIAAFPVGFVGAAESKAELHANNRGIAYATVLGRRGGSAMAAALVNALLRGLQ